MIAAGGGGDEGMGFGMTDAIRRQRCMIAAGGSGDVLWRRAAAGMKDGIQDG